MDSSEDYLKPGTVNDTLISKSVLNESLLKSTTKDHAQNVLTKPLSQYSFILFGAGLMMPWNAILAILDFFESSFPNYKPQFSILVAVSVPLFLV